MTVPTYTIPIYPNWCWNPAFDRARTGGRITREEFNAFYSRLKDAISLERKVSWGSIMFSIFYIILLAIIQIATNMAFYIFISLLVLLLVPLLVSFVADNIAFRKLQEFMHIENLTTWKFKLCYWEIKRKMGTSFVLSFHPYSTALPNTVKVDMPPVQLSVDQNKVKKREIKEFKETEVSSKTSLPENQC